MHAARASFILHYVRLSIFELAGRFFGRREREEERPRDRKGKENERKKGGGGRSKGRLSLEYCLNRPRAFPHEVILLPFAVMVLKSDDNNIIRYTRHSLSS